MAERRGHWLQALVLSLALHGAAAAAILDVIPVRSRPDPNDTPLQIEIATLEVETGSVGAATLTPARPVEPGEGQSVAPDTVSPTESTAVPVLEDEVLTPAEDLRSVIAPAPQVVQDVAAPSVSAVDLAALAPAGGPAPRSDAAPSSDNPAGGAQAETALAQLIGSIRDQLAQPCLLALPQATGSNGLRVTLLGENAARFPPLIDALEPPQDVTLSQTPLLVDARQCPAVNFARAYRSYPVYPLRIALDTASVTDGGALSGTVNGIPEGETLALILIDDNGVVQDLTRFFTAGTGTATAFDVPARLAGDPRQTAQLLIALTSPAPLDTMATRDGQTADDFFAALTAEMTDPAALRIGLATFDLR